MTNRWTFNNDELFELVRNGRKCGTCGRYSDDSPMANVGEIQEIFNSHGETIRIQITSVRKCRFCDIDDTWARTEGEGDLCIMRRHQNSMPPNNTWNSRYRQINNR